MKDHLNEVFALIVGAALLILALYNRPWWGDSAAGAMIGAAGIFLVVLLLPMVEGRLTPKVAPAEPWLKPWMKPWLLILFGAATALLLRSPSGRSPDAPIQVQMPSAGQLQIIFLILVVLLLFLLIAVFVRAIERGEGVSVESHWGGLGGGLGGFHVSPPMIYLLGIVLLLMISSAVAWRAYAPPDKEGSQKPQRQQTDAAQDAAPPSPSLSPSSASQP
jgi:hypothetical protein